MKPIADFLAYACAMGVIATAVMDLWAMAQKRLFGIPSLDYALVGRWLGHIPKGQFTHAPIGKASPVRGEALIGWSTHYGIGVIFAAVFAFITGANWRAAPTLWPALLFGVATVIAPYFILQPAMGAGVAARRTPAPNTARLRSLIAHLSFGVGLYVAGATIIALSA